MTDTARALDTSPTAAEHEAGELESLRRENLQLHEAMVTRAAIEQAKGMLMLPFTLNQAQAFAVLVRWSRAANIKLHTVARLLVDAIRAGDDLPGLAAPDLPQWFGSRLTTSPPGVDAPQVRLADT